MIQKIIKVGNSIAVTLPSSFAKSTNMIPGELVEVETDELNKLVTIKKTQELKTVKTAELSEWLESFNKKNKKGLTELAKK